MIHALHCSFGRHHFLQQSKQSQQAAHTNTHTQVSLHPYFISRFLQNARVMNNLLSARAFCLCMCSMVVCMCVCCTHCLYTFVFSSIWLCAALFCVKTTVALLRVEWKNWLHRPCRSLVIIVNEYSSYPQLTTPPK